MVVLPDRMFAVLGKDEGVQMFERFDKRNEETNERQSQLDIKRSMSSELHTD